MKKIIVITLLFVTACAPSTTIALTNTMQPLTEPSLRIQATLVPEAISAIPTGPTQYPPSFAEHKVEEYLRTNNDCGLPCFWGIIPGDTNLDDAIRFFQPFGITKRYAVGLYISSKDILNGASLFEENGKIVGVEAFGEGTFYDSASFLKSQGIFWDIWESYLPQRIIAQYGFPDRIWFDAYNNPEVSDPDKPFGYSIWFFYDEKDFLLVYSGITSRFPQYQVCLGGKIGENRFGNLSPNIQVLIHKDIHLEEFAVERGIDRKVNFYSEKNAEIPLDEFRKMIDHQEGCFNTPLEFQP